MIAVKRRSKYYADMSDIIEAHEEQTPFQRILLVEDDSSHVLLIKRALRGLCAEILTAASSAEALEILAEADPDLVISDLNLPDKAALLHIEDLRRARPELPLVVLTSSNSLAEAVEAMKLGARDFLVKDFDRNFRDVLRFSLGRLQAELRQEFEKRRLQREMQVLRVAIENSNDALAVMDPSGAVLYSNRSFLEFVRLCGGDPRSAGDFFSSLVSHWEALRDNLLRNLKEIKAGAVWNTEVLLSENKDAAFTLNLSALGLDVERGFSDRLQYVIWVRDVSEQKRREKFQREILSTTTHDLKGPLGAIIISSELLSESVQGSTGRAGDLALRIGSSARSAVNLIDEFLSARRIQEGAFILKPQLVAVGQVTSEVTADYETIAAARRISLQSPPANDSLKWRLDRLGFSRVLGNLLSNALKFTARGGHVGVNLEVRNGELWLDVRDTGSGMEPSEVQKIFERFSRLEKHSDTAGTGLGLFVVKSVVNAHGGKVEVSSQSGVGTTFSLSFPPEPPVNERGELICLDFA